jgi:hypothetical protein
VKPRGPEFGSSRRFSGSGEREFPLRGQILRDQVPRRMAVRAPGLARARAGSERLVDDGLDGARAAPAFCTAAEAAIDLLGATRKIVRSAYGIANIMVTKDVAGTDDHKNKPTFSETKLSRLK